MQTTTDSYRVAALDGQRRLDSAAEALRASLTTEQADLLEELLDGASAHAAASHAYVVQTLVEALPGLAGAIRDLADLASERCLG